MGARTKRLAIAFVLTVADVAIFNLYAADIWQTWGQNPLAQFDLLALLAIWISSAAVIWSHVLNDLRQSLRELNQARSQDPQPDPSEPRRDDDV